MNLIKMIVFLVFYSQTLGVFAYHDIKDTPFQFTITADINDDTDRFAIVFTNPLPRPKQPQKDRFNVVAAPNPFEVGVTFEVITQNHAPVKVQLVDLLGKLVEEGEYTVQELQTEQFGKNLSAGVYQAVITQGYHKVVQKIIKQ